MNTPTVLSIPHQVTRLEFDAGQPYEKLRARFGTALPVLDPQRQGAFAGRHARIQKATAEATRSALFRVVLACRPGAADDQRGRAQAMDRLADRRSPDRGGPIPPGPGGAAVRTAAHADLHRLRRPNPARHRPAQHGTFCFADPAIAEAGLDLDRQLADLLGALGVQADPLLREPSLAGQRDS